MYSVVAKYWNGMQFVAIKLIEKMDKAVFVEDWINNCGKSLKDGNERVLVEIRDENDDVLDSAWFDDVVLSI